MVADRSARIVTFLAAHGWGDAERRLLAADASFRHYDRLTGPAGSAVLMNAPPDKENAAVFVHLARLLGSLGLSAPRVLASDLEAGLVLLEDLGDTTFTVALEGGADPRPLYELATDTLIALQQRWQPEVGEGLAPYDERRLLDEALLFTDWALPALRGEPTPAALRDDYVAAWREVLAQVLTTAALPETLVLRDYHVDNLMVLESRSGVARCGLLDFQDALLGSPAYDLVSLLRDARRDVAPDLAAAMRARHRQAFADLDATALDAAYWVLGAQRNAKILGIFTRLDRRDGKPQYLVHIPRVWRLLEEELAQPLLAPVRAWFDRHVPPELRRIPPKGEAA